MSNNADYAMPMISRRNTRESLLDDLKQESLNPCSHFSNSYPERISGIHNTDKTRALLRSDDARMIYDSKIILKGNDEHKTMSPTAAGYDAKSNTSEKVAVEVSTPPYTTVTAFASSGTDKDDSGEGKSQKHLSHKQQSPGGDANTSLGDGIQVTYAEAVGGDNSLNSACNGITTGRFTKTGTTPARRSDSHVLANDEEDEAVSSIRELQERVACFADDAGPAPPLPPRHSYPIESHHSPASPPHSSHIFRTSLPSNDLSHRQAGDEKPRVQSGRRGAGKTMLPQDLYAFVYPELTSPSSTVPCSLPSDLRGARVGCRYYGL